MCLIKKYVMFILIFLDLSYIICYVTKSYTYKW